MRPIRAGEVALSPVIMVAAIVGMAQLAGRI
jgi:hypothetical protein